MFTDIYGHTSTAFYCIFVCHDLSLLPLVFENSKFHLRVILKRIPCIHELTKSKFNQYSTSDIANVKVNVSKILSLKAREN